MRIACLQFNPQLGNLAHNLERAEAIISRANPTSLDLLVLPEMAFSGYNFKSLHEIRSHLEPTAAGPSTEWARSTARRLACHVIVGYPEYCSQSPSAAARYNSAVLVSPEGNVLANYRKTFLFTTDESWCDEGSGFFHGEIPGGLGKMSMGICMDLNPRHFAEPFDKYEFANHVLGSQSGLAVVPMAWLTLEPAESMVEQAQVPDSDTIGYWISRLRPILDHGPSSLSSEAIFVACNRTGTERDAVFAGSSSVIGLSRGSAQMYGSLGRGTEDLLVCDVPSGGKAEAAA